MKKQIWKTEKEKELDPAIVEYISGEDIEFDKQLIPYDIKVNKAHAKMLSKVGLITEEDCNKILKAFDELPENFELTQELEDVHMNIEAYLVEKLGELGGKINTGRSRSSQAKTCMNLYMKDLLEKLEKEVKKFQTLLKKLADKYQDYEMPAYTHMQPAQPTTFGFWLESFIAILNKDLKRLEGCKKQVDVNPLGSGAAAGTKLPIDVAFTTNELGFSEKFENAMAELSSRGEPETECLFCLSMIMLHLGKMAQDLQLWSTFEFGMIKLGGKIATGSSMLPQKKNPDVFEMTRSRVAQVYALLLENLVLLKGLPSTYNIDVIVAKRPIPKGFKIVLDSLNAMSIALENITPNKARMKELVEKSGCKAIEETNDLVLAGIPFREAYKKIRDKYIKGFK